jgi:hypothetical protein
MERRISFQFDWFNSYPRGYTAVNVLTWDLLAQIGITENIFVDVDIPWAYARLDEYPSRSEVVFGHAVIGAHVAARIGRSAAFFVGLGVGIPSQGTLDGDDARVPSLAGNIRGSQDLYRFLPNQLPLRVGAGLELWLKPFFIQTDLAPSFLFSADDRRASIVMLDQGNNFGVRARFGLFGGLRVQESFVLTEAEDHVQTALEPFLGYESPGKAGLVARYGLLMALDQVGGFAFDRGKLLVNRFSVGARF